MKLRKTAAAAFDKAGLAAFEKLIRARFEAASEDPSSWTYRRMARHLARDLHVRNGTSRPISRWQSRPGLNRRTASQSPDCSLHGNRPKRWRGSSAGARLTARSQFRSTAAYDLDKLHRELLSKLGRANEALEAAWADFRKHPSKFAYDDLMKFVPKTERTRGTKRL